MKEKYLPSFHEAHLLEHLRQSTSNVFDYINSFKELIQRYNLLKDPFIIIARFIRYLRTDLKRKVTLFAPCILNEAYRKALEDEKSMQCSTPSSRDPWPIYGE